MADASSSGPPAQVTVQPPTQPSTSFRFRRKGKELVPASTSHHGAQSFESLDGDSAAKTSHRKDIYHTIFLLRLLTLPEIVPYILDEAEIWYSDRTFFYIDPNHGWFDIEGSERSRDKTPILHYGPFSDVDLKCIRGVKFTVGCQRRVREGFNWFEVQSTSGIEAQEARFAQTMSRKEYKKLLKASMRPSMTSFELDHNDLEFRVLSKSWSFQLGDRSGMKKLVGIKVGDYVNLTGHATLVDQPAALRIRYARIEVFYHVSMM